jgi:Lectin C-type domain
MRGLSRTVAVFVALWGVACAVDRGGAGEQAAGATAGSGPAVAASGGSGGTAGSGAGLVSGGNAGVFGVAVGNEGGSSGSAIQNHEGGASEDTDSGTVEPVDTGTMVVVDVVVAKEAASEASMVPACATHAGGQTFIPSGAVSTHCYWPHTDRSKWQEAVDACVGEGGHLVTIASLAESTFVVKLLANLTNTERIWLGGTDKKTVTDDSGGGPYQWITAEPFSYAPWAQDNPDGNCEDTCNGSPCQCQHRVCVDRGGIFWDRFEGDQNYWVCESEP